MVKLLGACSPFLLAATMAAAVVDGQTPLPAQQQQVSDHYVQFAKNTEQKTGNRLDPHALLPDSGAQKYLQAYYTAPVGPPNNAIDLDDARDGSAWTAANTRYNDFFRQICA